jgi:hypothetical protein
MSSQNSTCEHCVYCVADMDNKALVFKCRRYPPQCVGGVVQSQMGMGFASQSLFPQVNKNDSCGEFLAKPPALKLLS